MGCDIHLFTEVKLAGKWHTYSTPDIDRWYALFEKMAGVRGDESNAIAPPRGLPADISAVAAWEADNWSLDGHSHSWLNAAEIAELCEWAEAQRKLHHPEGWRSWEMDSVGYLCGNGWSSFHKYPEHREPGLEDIRWIFWFDN